MSINLSEAEAILANAGKHHAIKEINKLLTDNKCNNNLCHESMNKIMRLLIKTNQLTELQIAQIIKAVAFYSPKDAFSWLNLVIQPIHEPIAKLTKDFGFQNNPPGEKIYILFNGIILGVFETADPKLFSYLHKAIFASEISPVVKKLIWGKNEILFKYSQIKNQNSQEKLQKVKKFEEQLNDLIQAFLKRLENEDINQRYDNILIFVNRFTAGIKEYPQKPTVLGVPILEQINHKLFLGLPPQLILYALRLQYSNY